MPPKKRVNPIHAHKKNPKEEKMVFINEWPVPNDVEKARTVDHERNAELFSHHGYFQDHDNLVIEWRLNCNGKDIFVKGKTKTKSFFEDGTEWINIKESSHLGNVKFVHWYYKIEHIKIPESLHEKTKYIFLIIEEAIKVNEFTFGRRGKTIVEVHISGFEEAKIEYTKG